MTTLAVVGDIYLQDHLPQNGGLNAVKEILQQSDITFGNLETPVSQRGAPIEKWVNFRMDPKYLTDVKTAGFDLLCIANNHMMDYGMDAFFDTMSYLDDAGIQHVGGGANLDTAWTPQIMTTGDHRIAFVAAASTLGPGLAAAEDRAGVAPVHVSESYNIDFAASMEQPGSVPYVFTRPWQEDLDRAVEVVSTAKNNADFVMVAMHWGVPPLWRSRFQDGLADYQPIVGHALIDAGVDLIVGHHPHSLQAVEIYKGKPIFYSLGNFMFHRKPAATGNSIINRNAPYSLNVNVRDRIWAESMILLVDLNDDGGANYTIQPVLLDSEGNPTLLKGREAIELLERLSSMSPGTVIDVRDDLGYVIH